MPGGSVAVTVYVVLSGTFLRVYATEPLVDAVKLPGDVQRSMLLSPVPPEFLTVPVMSGGPAPSSTGGSVGGRRTAATSRSTSRPGPSTAGPSGVDSRIEASWTVPVPLHWLGVVVLPIVGAA